MLKILLMLFLFFESGFIYAAGGEVCGSKPSFADTVSDCECKSFPQNREHGNVFGLKPYSVCGYYKDELVTIGRFYYRGDSKVSGVLRVYYSEYRRGKEVVFIFGLKGSNVSGFYHFLDSDLNISRKLYSMGVLTKKMSRAKCWEAPVSMNVFQIVDNSVEMDDRGLYITKYDLLTAGNVKDCSNSYFE
jgi:hypothetical protein